MKYFILGAIFLLSGCSNNPIADYSRKHNCKCEAVYGSINNCYGGYWENGKKIHYECDYHFKCSDDKELIWRM